MRSPILDEIANWKLEAKLEDNHRYFFHTADVDVLENGSRCYVIGRKGTGKTAISEYLHQKAAPQRFSQKLTFKNFPFNDLYQLQNTSFRAPNQYITLWKYLIYSSIAKMMLVNENIDADLRTKLAQIYSNDPVTSLARTISKWTSNEFQITALGVSITRSKTRSAIDNNTAWIERVEILEKLIEDHLDDSSYLIIFDELDEDYKDISATVTNEQYKSLLTSLFKAVQDIRSVFPVHRYRILPLLFLRDDIYDILKDPDKTKWSDLAIELDWNIYKIKDLLGFRISRATNPADTPMPFQDAWNQIFSRGEVQYGTKGRMGPFDYITRSTLIRPRDYVRYLKACAELALAKHSPLIQPSVVKKVDNVFSNYLRSEMEDELDGILPEVRQILDVVAHMRQPTFSFKAFSHAYRNEVHRGVLEDRSAEYVLGVLFHFSVVGNQTRFRNARVFRYLNKEARFNSNDLICVHRGLFKSLQIY